MTAATPIVQSPSALEQFLDPPQDGLRYELVDGKLVGHDMSPISSWVATELAALLRNAAVGPPRLGWAMTEASLLCFPFLRPPHGRRPDVAYFSLERLPILTLKPSAAVPNFAAEVISPSDNFYYVERKIPEYLRAGIDTVWVVNWDARQVRIHHGDDRNARLCQGDDVLTLASMPNFRIRTDDLFPPLGMAEILTDADLPEKTIPERGDRS